MSNLFSITIQYLMAGVFLLFGLPGAIFPTRFAEEGFHIPSHTLYEHESIRYNVSENIQSLCYVWISFGALCALGPTSWGTSFSIIVYYLFEIAIRIIYLRDYPPSHVDPTKLPPKSSLIGAFILPLGFLIVNCISIYLLSFETISIDTTSGWIVIIIIVIHLFLAIYSIFFSEKHFLEHIPCSSEILSHGTYLYSWTDRLSDWLSIPLFLSPLWIGIVPFGIFPLFVWSVANVIHIGREITNLHPWENGITFSKSEHFRYLGFHSCSAVVLFICLFV